MIIRYAEEKNFIELRQFYDGMCKGLSGKDFLPEAKKRKEITIEKDLEKGFDYRKITIKEVL